MAVPGCECERCTGKRDEDALVDDNVDRASVSQRIDAYERRLRVADIKLDRSAELVAALERRLAALEARVGTGAEP